MKKPIFNRQAEVLSEICEEHFECNLQERNRVTNNVNARVAFSVILRKKGYSTIKIGKFIARDHASILHYLKKVDMYLKTDKDFKKKFIKVESIFNEKCIEFRSENYANFVETVYKEKTNVSLPYYNNILIDHINNLNNENKALYLEIENLKNEKDIRNSSTDRVQNLIDMVVQRTRLGKEEDIRLKLNRFYNAMEY